MKDGDSDEKTCLCISSRRSSTQCQLQVCLRETHSLAGRGATLNGSHLYSVAAALYHGCSDPGSCPEQRGEVLLRPRQAWREGLASCWSRNARHLTTLTPPSGAALVLPFSVAPFGTGERCTLQLLKVLSNPETQAQPRVFFHCTCKCSLGLQFSSFMFSLICSFFIS